MKIRLFHFEQLSAEHLQAWSNLQIASAECDSPYFRPEFHALAAEVGRPVMVGVLEQEDRPVGFFPFEKGSFGTAQPVGLRLSDFQGVLVEPGIAWSGKELLRGCDLRRFQYDHLLVCQAEALGGVVGTVPSPIVNLSAGFAAYREVLKKRGEKEFDRTLKKQEKMGRELAPAQFCLHEPSQAALAACLQWKGAQYERTAALNVFRHPWVTEFLTRIAQFESPHFHGLVSTLRAGNELIAVHVGMRTDRVAHHWFPAHAAEHASVKYSPGLQLVTGMIEDLAAIGIERIDFGAGDFRYKRDFGTGEVHVAQGIAGGSAWESSWQKGWQEARSTLRKTAEFAGFTAPVDWYRQIRNWSLMQ